MASGGSDRNTSRLYYTNMPSAGLLEAFWLKGGIAKLRRTDYFAADSSRLLLLLVNTGQDT
jgi:hypothetical protein